MTKNIYARPRRQWISCLWFYFHNSLAKITWNQQKVNWFHELFWKCYLTFILAFWKYLQFSKFECLLFWNFFSNLHVSYQIFDIIYISCRISHLEKNELSYFKNSKINQLWIAKSFYNIWSWKIKHYITPGLDDIWINVSVYRKL